MNDDSQKPRRRFEVQIRAGGHDWKEVCVNLEEMLYHLFDHGPECRLVSGRGWIHVIETEGQTEENYNRELQEYVREHRSAAHRAAICVEGVRDRT